MINTLFNRNALYIPQDKQLSISNYKVCFAGCGIGSNISECALRLGFLNQTLIDGDRVDLTNLNRQNYTLDDINQFKSSSLYHRLLSINSRADIKVENTFLNSKNLSQLVSGHDLAINALDFQSDIPFLFDEFCQKNFIPIIHPYNIGWATLVFVIHPSGLGLSHISPSHIDFEKKVAAFLIDNIDYKSKQWLQDILYQYEYLDKKQSPPQLAIGSWLAAGVCTDVMYKIANNLEVKYFPEFYFVTSHK